MSKVAKMIQDDHRKVQSLFRQFESSGDPKKRKRIIDRAILELEVHTVLEEELIYPAICEEEAAESVLLDEVLEGHDALDHLMAELKGIAPNERIFDAKAKLLADHVRRHIREAESKMLPRLRDGDHDLDEMAEALREHKQALLAEYREHARGVRPGSRMATSAATD